MATFRLDSASKSAPLAFLRFVESAPGNCSQNNAGTYDSYAYKKPVPHAVFLDFESNIIFSVFFVQSCLGKNCK